MKTTVVYRRPHESGADIGGRLRRPVPPLPVTEPWSTARLGVVVSAVAMIVTALLDLATPLSNRAIVLAVMAVAFAVSCHATVRRSSP